MTRVEPLACEEAIGSFSRKIAAAACDVLLIVCGMGADRRAAG